MEPLLCYIRPFFVAFLIAHIMFLTEIATAALRSTWCFAAHLDYTSV